MSEIALNENDLQTLIRLLRTDEIPHEILREAKKAQAYWHRIQSGPLPPGTLLSIVVAHERPTHTPTPKGHTPGTATGGKQPTKRKPAKKRATKKRPVKKKAEEKEVSWEPSDVAPGSETKKGTKVCVFDAGRMKYGEFQSVLDGRVRVKFNGDRKHSAFPHENVRIAKRG